MDRKEQGRERRGGERYTGNEAWGGGRTWRQALSCSFCCISYVIQFVFQEENQFLMTILCAALKGREFLSPGKVAVGDGG